MFRIEADVLIPGRGDPIKNAALVVDGTVIAYAGPIEGAPSAAGATVANAPALMPGMWDVHGHFMGIRTLYVEDIARTPLAVLASRSTKDAEVAVSAGFTSIRELSGLGVHLARVVAEGTVRGPHIYGAGGALSQTGGHGDLHTFPLDFVHDVLRRTGFSYLCDGVPECLKAVRMQLRVGARVIKVLASAGGPAGWGLNGHEVGHLVEAGMKPLSAIEAATATGPLTLGPQAPKSGELKAGYDADFLALAKSPLDRIGVLAEPENIRKVWIAGQLAKDLPI